MSTSPIEIDEEAAVVAQSREGDAAAFNELVRRYERKIFRLAQHITQNREDAEDVLQEIVYEGLRAPRPVSGTVEVLHLDCAHRGEPGTDEAAQAQDRPVGFAR